MWTSNVDNTIHAPTLLISIITPLNSVRRGYSTSTSTLFALLSNFIFPPPGHYTSTRNPISASSQSCCTEREILFLFFNPTKHLWISTSIRISIQISSRAEFVQSIQVRLDMLTVWWDCSDDILLEQTSGLVSYVSNSESIYSVHVKIRKHQE